MLAIYYHANPVNLYHQSQRSLWQVERFNEHKFGSGQGQGLFVWKWTGTRIICLEVDRDKDYLFGSGQGQGLFGRQWDIK